MPPASTSGLSATPSERPTRVRYAIIALIFLITSVNYADRATFSDPTRPAAGLRGVWVNGVRTLSEDGTVRARAGRMLRRNSTQQQGILG